MSQILDLATKLFSKNSTFTPVKIISTEKRVRGILNGHVLFDTTSAKLVWEHRYFPHYWVPKKDFTSAAKFTDDKPISGIQQSTSELTTSKPGAGETKTLKALVVPDSFNSELAGLVKIDFKNLDAAYEELEPILYHPKDPFHRVDCLPSGRHVKVEIDGVVVADTSKEGGVMSLWETNFPGRWYLPPTAVQWQYLSPSDTKTGCPYKGEASYYSATINGNTTKDVVWWYPQPTQESAPIRGMLCFYPDKVRTWVDGVEIERVGMPKGSLKEVRGEKAEEEKTSTNGEHSHAGEEKSEQKKKKEEEYLGKACNC